MDHTTTPPPKRRRLEAVMPSPPKMADLLSSFGAMQSPTPVTNRGRALAGRDLRQKVRKTYAESESEGSSPAKDNESAFGDSPAASPESSKTSMVNDADQDNDESDSDSELEVIEVAPRKAATRALPARATRSTVSYASPKKVYKKKVVHKKSKKLLRFNTGGAPKADTERNQIRRAIADVTKPKREAFILANKDSFLPLLPETSYVDKLERLHAMKDEGHEEVQRAYDYPATITQQPQGVTAVMKPYQLEGLTFLLYMHENGMSSILGDEMGLGKTLQTLSLFQHLAEHKPVVGEDRPHLVVCPLSVLSSWMNEARKWVPNLNVVRFHGPKAERERLKKDILIKQRMDAKKRAQMIERGDDKPIDVIVTTYETFTSERHWFRTVFAWRYCVLDEGHRIKNGRSNSGRSCGVIWWRKRKNKCDISSALQSIAAEYRLLLTGTPLQNNLREMWALLHWLYPDVFTLDTADRFANAFDLTRGKASTTFMDEARRLLELVMLRRMKNSPGVDLGLPPKTEVMLYVPLTPMQRFWYTRLLTKADTATLTDLFQDAKTKEIEAQGLESANDMELAKLEHAAAAADILDAGVGDVWAESKEIMEQALKSEENPAEKQTSDYRKLMNLVMQLRKVCSHPYLLPHAAPEPYYLGEHVKTASGKFIMLDKLVDELVFKQGKKILIFSGFTKTLNLCEDLLALKGGNAHNATFRYHRLDGGTGRARRNLGIRMFNDKASDYKVMLISTRAGGLGINLASAETVIFLDEDWNPQITLQAEARAHRIGQTKPVTIYKLCSAGTVEEQMQGRIRKKLYLSAKITESMRNIHSATPAGKKRKRTTMEAQDDEPHLGADQLKSLLRKGAQTLATPQVDVTLMLGWDFETMIEKCKDKGDAVVVKEDPAAAQLDEQAWLNTMEKVETAVFEGKVHQRKIDEAIKQEAELSRADRRIGKNVTVMMDGFAINKESLQCADWEAVPTFAGKDPRLADVKREKKAKMVNQSFCQHCFDGGDMVLCDGCPRAYHMKCLAPEFKVKAKGWAGFYCAQHECHDCQSKTSEAGGLIFRCRWCELGYCEDCLDWDKATLVGATLPELEMLNFGAVDQAWYINCHYCTTHWAENPLDHDTIMHEKKIIERDYAKFVADAEGQDVTVLNTHPGASA